MIPLRLRLRFTKTGRVRFIGHLDLVRVWERAIRRADLPLAFTEGFSPRPRMHFGLALPTTFTSSAEYLDIDLRDDVDASTATERLDSVLPEGIGVVAAAPVDPDTASLQSVVVASEYLVATPAPPEIVEAGIRGLLAAEALPFELERKGRRQTIDLRPGVLEIALVASSDGDPGEVAATIARDLGPEGIDASVGCRIVRMRLAARPRSFRPTEVCSVTEPRIVPKLVHRSAQLMGGPVAFTEPLPAGSPAEPAPRSEPVEQRSRNGPLREEAPPDTPAAPHTLFA